MIEILRNVLQDYIDKIDSGNSNISEDQQLEIINFFQKINSEELSKIESANYIGVSRATFDNYINNGWIPKGHKRQGFKELSWRKCDLDDYLKSDYNVKKK